MKKLNKFDSIYNKFIYEWSQSQDLHNILNNINDQSIQIDYIDDDNENNKIDIIRSEFNNKFPVYLLKKCQSKFPINDNIVIPNNIINSFWDKYSELIIEKLADVAIDKISSLLYDLFVELFGNDNEYNEEFCNDSALQLVNIE